MEFSEEELALIKRLLKKKTSSADQPPHRSPGSGWVIPRVHSMSSVTARALLKKLNSHLKEDGI
jgi:hypothetical protein